MLTNRYLTSQKNVHNFFNKLIDGVAPDRFTQEHLKSIGFGSSNDRAFIPLLKDLGFLTPEGQPTPRYHAYRDRSKSKLIMAEALKEAYEDLFHIREIPTTNDRAAIEGVFRTKLNSSERVAKEQASTFLTLLPEADLSLASKSQSDFMAASEPDEVIAIEHPESLHQSLPMDRRANLSTELHYTIQVHLPATKDIEVFNAIFRSLRDNLLV